MPVAEALQARPHGLAGLPLQPLAAPLQVREGPLEGGEGPRGPSAQLAHLVQELERPGEAVSRVRPGLAPREALPGVGPGGSPALAPGRPGPGRPGLLVAPPPALGPDPSQGRLPREPRGVLDGALLRGRSRAAALVQVARDARQLLLRAPALRAPPPRARRARQGAPRPVRPQRAPGEPPPRARARPRAGGAPPGARGRRGGAPPAGRYCRLARTAALGSCPRMAASQSCTPARFPQWSGGPPSKPSARR